MIEKKLKQKFPNLPVIHFEASSEISMRFDCPWCHRVHLHGRGSGTRASHCEVYHGEYIVIDPSDKRRND